MGKWEECTPGLPRGRWHQPQGTMAVNGDILITRNTWKMMECPEFAIILFDSRNSVIGVKPVRAGIRNVFKVEPYGRCGGRIIRAASLCTQFRIKLEKRIRFHGAEIDQDGILNLDLNRAAPAFHNENRSAARTKLISLPQRYIEAVYPVEKVTKPQTPKGSLEFFD